MSTTGRSCPACHTPLPEEAQFCMHCGKATPTDPGVPPRTMPTGAMEVASVRRALGERYRIERVLGEGGMATVYLAEDLKHRRRVAVKVMRPELAATLGADRFLREVEIAAQLSHPHILPMYDSGQADGVLYYVMPYVEGETLAARLAREGELPVPEALRLAREVGQALAYAHRQGIVHRDIKPANILLSDGHALVADFGIARALEAEGEAITRTGLAVGTPQYMSPEQATGAKDVDNRTDLFALGAVLYEMLTGEPPFAGRTPQAVVARVLTEEPRPLSAARQGLPPGLEGLMARALAKRPVDRQADATTLVGELEAAEHIARSGSFTPADGRAAAPTVGATPRGWLVAGALATAALVFAAFLAGRWGLPPWSLYLALALLACGGVMIALTAGAERRRAAGRAAGHDRWLTWRTAAAGGLGALCIWTVTAGVAVARRPTSSAVATSDIRIAVLPFENLGSSEDAYFADGFADEVRGKLSRIHGLSVTASSSTAEYRASSKSPQEIARELGVNYVLVGRVRWAGSGDARRVQVIPEVVDARTGAVSWQQTFDATPTDVFEVQRDIATRTAAAIGIALGPEDRQQIAVRPTENLAAYDAFLKGTAVPGADPASIRQAIAHLETAVRLDSTFLEAWATLAGRFTLLYSNSTPTPEVAARAKAALDRAAALDPDAAATHAARAGYYQIVAKNSTLAYEEMQLALRSDPNAARLLGSVSGIERSLGRWEEALSHAQQAWRLDPRSLTAAVRLQNVLLWMRRYPEALEMSEAALALAPGDLSTSQDKAMVHIAQGDLPSARAAVKQVSPAVAPGQLVAFFANYWDMYWVLDEAQVRLLLQLGPEAFDDDVGTMHLVRAQTYWMSGDTAAARREAALGLPHIDKILASVPDDAQRFGFKGLLLAYLGRGTEATAMGRRSLELLPITQDSWNGPYMQHLAARIELANGNQEAALDLLEPLLKVPYFLSPGWLRVDPTWDPLRGNPRFERLARGDR